MVFVLCVLPRETLLSPLPSSTLALCSFFFSLSLWRIVPQNFLGKIHNPGAQALPGSPRSRLRRLGRRQSLRESFLGRAMERGNRVDAVFSDKDNQELMAGDLKTDAAQRDLDLFIALAPSYRYSAHFTHWPKIPQPSPVAKPMLPRG